MKLCIVMPTTLKIVICSWCIWLGACSSTPQQADEDPLVASEDETVNQATSDDGFTNPLNNGGNAQAEDGAQDFSDTENFADSENNLLENATQDFSAPENFGNNQLAGTAIEAAAEPSASPNGLLVPNSQAAATKSATAVSNAVSVPLNQVLPTAPVEVAGAYAAHGTQMTASELTWVGYDYDRQRGVVHIELVAQGRPQYNVFQEVNHAGQPELVVRFLQTSMRRKIRRDIDASEFRSPVAFVRLRAGSPMYVDVVLTLRDTVRPRLHAKNGRVRLTYQVPAHYLGQRTIGSGPITPAKVSPGSELMPELDAGSELPLSMAQAKLANAFAPDHGAATFGDAPAAIDGLMPPVTPPAIEAVAVPVYKQADDQLAAPKPVNPLPPQATNHGVGANDFNPEMSRNFNDRLPATQQPNAVDPRNSQEINSDDEEFDDDTLDDFDDGKGESIDEIDKFDVRQISPLPVLASYTVASFSITGVAQDDLDQVGDNFDGQATSSQTASGAESFTDGGDSTSDSAPTNGVVANFPSNSGTSEALFDATVADQRPGNSVGVSGFGGQGTNGGIPGNSLNAGVLPEPVTDPAVDLQGQEALGRESEVAPAAPGAGPKVKLDFRGAPLAEVIRILSDESGINFIMPPEVDTRRVTTNLTNIPFNDALKAVLDSHALGMVEIGPNLVRIDTLENLRSAKEKEEARRKIESRLRPTKILYHRLSYAKAEEAKVLLNALLEAAKKEDDRVSVQADGRSNSLVIHASPAILTTVKTLLERIDLETPQVKIASRIVEVTKTFSEDFGVSWGTNLLTDPGRGLGFGTLVFPSYALSNYTVDAGGAAAGNGNFNFRFGSVNNSVTLDLALSMAEKRGTTEILQSSDLLVEDNVEAQIVAGQTDYFQPRVASVETSGAGGASLPLQEVNYNLSMRVTPHITADGAVQMKISIESDSPLQTNKQVAAKSNRSIVTSLLKRNGETAVIGGIYTTDKSQVQDGVPFFSSLPIIGALFRSSYNENKKRELLVMVTPTIVSNSASSASTADVGAPMNMAANIGGDVTGANQAIGINGQTNSELENNAAVNQINETSQQANQSQGNQENQVNANSQSDQGESQQDSENQLEGEANEE